MKICRHLAMTRCEMENFTLPEDFSPALLLWEADFPDLPRNLTAGNLWVIPDPKDPDGLFNSLTEASPSGVLLDFRKPGQEAFAKALAEAFPCPVAVSEIYGKETAGPVFLPPCPPDQPLEAHLSPWKGRELWLDVAPEVLELRLTPTGCEARSLRQPPEGPPFTDENLHCRYRSEVFSQEIRFTLWRDRQMLEAHIREAQSLGVTKVIGLFQEWSRLG